MQLISAAATEIVINTEQIVEWLRDWGWIPTYVFASYAVHILVIRSKWGQKQIDRHENYEDYTPIYSYGVRVRGGTSSDTATTFLIFAPMLFPVTISVMIFSMIAKTYGVICTIARVVGGIKRGN